MILTARWTTGRRRTVTRRDGSSVFAHMIKRVVMTFHPRSEAYTEGSHVGTQGTETHVKGKEEITVSHLCFYNQNTPATVSMIDQMDGSEKYERGNIKLIPILSL